MNIDELYALAKKADLDEPWWCCLDGHDIDDPNIGDDDRNYIAAASPDVVTALIDRVRELEMENASLKNTVEFYRLISD